VTQANYTHMVAEAVEVFGLDPQAAVRPLHGGTANVSFVVDGEPRRIITFCVESTPDRIERLADVLEHLRAHGFASNQLMRSPRGELVHVIDGVPTIVKAFVEGEVLTTIDAARARSIGGVLGQLHRLPVPPGFAADHGMTCETMARMGGDAKDPSFAGWLIQALDEIPADWMELPVGLAHGDLFPDNLIEVDGGAIVAIDFEEACLYPLVFDLGMALAGFADAGCLSRATTAALLEGYRAHRELSAAERAAVPTMVEVAAMATACWRFELSQREGPVPGELRDWREAQATHAVSRRWRQDGVWTALLDA